MLSDSIRNDSRDVDTVKTFQAKQFGVELLKLLEERPLFATRGRGVSKRNGHVPKSQRMTEDFSLSSSAV